jgi:PDZ domain
VPTLDRGEVWLADLGYAAKFVIILGSHGNVIHASPSVLNDRGYTEEIMIVRMIFLALLIVTLQGTTLRAGQSKPDIPASSTPREVIDKLIKQLGSTRFEQREAAMKKLMKIGEALPALRQAAQSSDAEVRTRARQILEAWRDKLAAREFQRMLARCKGKEVDRFIAEVALLKDATKAEHWEGVFDLAEVTLRVAGFKGTTFTIPDRTMMSNKAYTTDVRAGSAIRFERLIAGSIDIQTHMSHVVVVSGGDVTTGPILNSIVFANGDVKVGALVGGGLIICDGNVAIRGDILDSVIIARGTAKVSGSARNSIIIENEKKTLGVFKFFDLGQLGAEFAEVDGGVSVTLVQDGKPLAQAGLRKDDIVTDINGVPVDSPETCRLVLRQRIWQNKEATLKLQRGDKSLELTVKVAD